MPTDFAVGGLVVIAGAIVAMRITGMRLREGGFLGPIFLFLATAAAQGIALVARDRDLSQVMVVLQALAVIVGWYALLGTLALMHRVDGSE
ncbi:MAG: hypothetical protein QNJ98_03470 [Planctomycetota bacterium]|nr:hypothetical protein [Planctomycetota bacterium]